MAGSQENVELLGLIEAKKAALLLQMNLYNPNSAGYPKAERL
jgi:hypothetical protein